MIFEDEDLRRDDFRKPLQTIRSADKLSRLPLSDKGDVEADKLSRPPLSDKDWQ